MLCIKSIVHKCISNLVFVEAIIICFSFIETYFLFILHTKIHLRAVLTKQILFKIYFLKTATKSIFLKPIFLKSQCQKLPN